MRKKFIFYISAKKNFPFKFSMTYVTLIQQPVPINKPDKKVNMKIGFCLQKLRKRFM